MNKINVCLAENHAISGYNNILIENLENIVNGSIDDILFIYSDQIDHPSRNSVIMTLFKKLRNKGTLNLVFCNIYSICKQIYKTNMSSSTISSLLASKRSFMTEAELDEIVYSLKELSIINKQYNNNNIVVKIKKEM